MLLFTFIVTSFVSTDNVKSEDSDGNRW